MDGVEARFAAWQMGDERAAVWPGRLAGESAVSYIVRRDVPALIAALADARLAATEADRLRVVVRRLRVELAEASRPAGYVRALAERDQARAEADRLAGRTPTGQRWAFGD